MIRPPSELRRKKIDSLITEASETKTKSPPETAGNSSQESLVPSSESHLEKSPEKNKSLEIEDDEGELQIADDEIQELPIDEDDEEQIELSRESAKKTRKERTELVQLRTGSIVKVKVLPGSFQESGNKKCSHCHLILSSRVSMKVNPS